MQLRSWALYRYPQKSKHWVMGKYWRIDDGQGWRFQPRAEGRALRGHTETAITYHVKVQGTRSPYDGDWVYWSRRLGRHPTINPHVARLLKLQAGRCRLCELYFTDGDVIEIDHIIPRKRRGSYRIDNLQLLHRHCHQRKTAQEQGRGGAYDKRHVAEEPCEGKLSSTVL